MKPISVRKFWGRRTDADRFRRSWVTRSRRVLDTELQRGHVRDIIREVHRAVAAQNPGPRSEARAPFTIGVTSPRLGDGKTTVSMAIANSLAQDFEGPTTLVDADFETHSIAAEFGLGAVAGLVEVLAGSATPTEVTHVFPNRNALRVVPAGVDLERSPRLIRSGEGTERLRELGVGSSFMVFDLPATIGSASAPLLARHCDAVIVVTRTGETSKRELAQTLDKLRDASVVGVVFNRWTSRIPGLAERMLGLGR